MPRATKTAAKTVAKEKHVPRKFANEAERHAFERSRELWVNRILKMSAWKRDIVISAVMSIINKGLNKEPAK